MLAGVGVTLRTEHHGDPGADYDVYSREDGWSEANPVLVCVHGGAWRTGDKKDFHDFVLHLVRSTGFAAVSVNYRLSLHPARPHQDAQHPQHVEDVAKALLGLEAGDPKRPWTGFFDHVKLILIGHSCGAHICSSFLFDANASPFLSSERVRRVRDRVIGLVASDPIFDPADLLDEYAEYTAFLVAAFGTRAGVEAQTSSRFVWATNRRLHVLISHSNDDELLTPRQARGMARCLYRLGGHQTRYSGQRSFSGNGLIVHVDFDAVHGKHDEVLQNGSLAAQVLAWLVDQGREGHPTLRTS